MLDDNDLLDDEWVDRKKSPHPKKWVMMVCTGLMVLGYVFRILHWPGVAVVFITGAGVMFGYAACTQLITRGANMLANVMLVLPWGFMLFLGLFNERSILVVLVVAVLAFTASLFSIKRKSDQ